MQLHFPTSKPGFREKAAAVRGVTLVEVMVSVVLFWMAIVTVVMSMTQAYRLSAQVRYRDQARFVLSSVSDQFSRAEYKIGAAGTGVLTVQDIFVPTSGAETGIGLAWRNDLNVFALPVGSDMSNFTVGGASDLVVPLGTLNGTIPVQGFLKRKVEKINANTGLPAGAALGSAGFLLRGDFRITFTFLGRQYEQSTTVLRAVDPRK